MSPKILTIHCDYQKTDAANGIEVVVLRFTTEAQG